MSSNTIKISYIILILMIITLVFMVYTKVGKNEMVYVKSNIDGESYLVRNTKDKKKASNLLAAVKGDIFDVSNHLSSKLKSQKESDIKRYQPNKEYIDQLARNLKNVVIKESAFNTVYTSYTVNKGEAIVFCIRSKAITNLINANTIHNKNLVMYVALHEIAHVACPEYGHTDLFKKIFKFITETAMEMGIYQKVDFDRDPVEYCGMRITDSIV
jgi:Mimiviridae putative metallopeptidase WLM domain protein